ncbi:MAG: hypothetical protein ACOZQL_36730 [Myxococcota bacterium]
MKRLRGPLVLLGACLIADVAFTFVAGHDGLLAPFGPVQLSALGCGALTLGLRLVVTFVALPWFAWRATDRLRA